MPYSYIYIWFFKGQTFCHVVYYFCATLNNKALTVMMVKC